MPSSPIPRILAPRGLDALSPKLLAQSSETYRIRSPLSNSLDSIGTLYYPKVRGRDDDKTPFMPNPSRPALSKVGGRQKPRRFILSVFAMLMLLLFCGCSATTPAEASFEPPQIQQGFEPLFFADEAELLKEVRFVKNGNAEKLGIDNPDYLSLADFEFYFVPAQLPEKVRLTAIRVRQRYCSWRYCEPGREAEENPTFLFSWIRAYTGVEVDLERNLKEAFPNAEVVRMGDYYIAKLTQNALALKDEEGGDQLLFQQVFWQQGSFYFEALVPGSFTQEDIEKYCVAKRVEVKQG
ncbi:MAG: hypothetical protein LBU47_04685 [Christensenellaceae bacterium]|nr:hypothetical protein [Christensenellaceae bacterium]